MMCECHPDPDHTAGYWNYVCSEASARPGEREAVRAVVDATSLAPLGFVERIVDAAYPVIAAAVLEVAAGALRADPNRLMHFGDVARFLDRTLATDCDADA